MSRTFATHHRVVSPKDVRNAEVSERVTPVRGTSGVGVDTATLWSEARVAHRCVGRACFAIGAVSLVLLGAGCGRTFVYKGWEHGTFSATWEGREVPGGGSGEVTAQYVEVWNSFQSTEEGLSFRVPMAFDDPWTGCAGVPSGVLVFGWGDEIWAWFDNEEFVDWGTPPGIDIENDVRYFGGELLLDGYAYEGDRFSGKITAPLELGTVLTLEEYQACPGQVDDQFVSYPDAGALQIEYAFDEDDFQTYREHEASGLGEVIDFIFST